VIVPAHRAYVLGPMTGYFDDNREAFRIVTKVLRSLGFEVISPDELDDVDPPMTPSWEGNLTRDLPHVVTCGLGVASAWVAEQRWGNARILNPHRVEPADLRSPTDRPVLDRGTDLGSPRAVPEDRPPLPRVSSSGTYLQ
jgi:hypothetical protein